MKARYSQEGKSIDYRPAEAVSAGDIVVLGTLIGIARLDIPVGTLGALSLHGVYEVVKGNGAITAGTVIYWDSTNNVATTIATGNTYLGKAVYDADAIDISVYVLLNAPHIPAVPAETESDS